MRWNRFVALYSAEKRARIERTLRRRGVGVSLRNLIQGARCRRCRRCTAIYNRSINANMAATLLRLVRWFELNPGREWCHTENDLRATWPGFRTGREEAKLRFWGLVEQHPDASPNSPSSRDPHNGMWRVTDAGREYANGTLALSRFALTYNNWLLEFAGEEVTIQFSLGNGFNYQEIRFANPGDT